MKVRSSWGGGKGCGTVLKAQGGGGAAVERCVTAQNFKKNFKARRVLLSLLYSNRKWLLKSKEAPSHP